MPPEAAWSAPALSLPRDSGTLLCRLWEPALVAFFYKEVSKGKSSRTSMLAKLCSVLNVERF